jgi:hypothetical protein
MKRSQKLPGQLSAESQALFRDTLGAYDLEPRHVAILTVSYGSAWSGSPTITTAAASDVTVVHSASVPSYAM